MRGGSGRTVVVALVTTLLLAACVGPARTEHAYLTKASHASKMAVSVIASAELAVVASARGDATAAYTSVQLREAESTANAVIDSFGSIQPPTTDMDHVRSELLTLLDETSTALAELRIAAYRGRLGRLPELAAPLAGLARELRGFHLPVAP